MRNWKLRLALVLVAAIVLSVAVPAMAAEETYTVSGSYKINDRTDISTEKVVFDLYKIGSVDEKGKPVLDDAVKNEVPTDFNLDVDKNKDTDHEGWTKAWLEKAKVIADYLPEDTDRINTVTNADGSFSFDSVENGLYLLKSDSEPIKDPKKDKDGSTVTWSPQPMLVMVLNGDVVELSVKPIPEKTGIPKYEVVKTWQDTGYKSSRPKEIKVEIYYDYKTGQKNTPIETVTLNDKNNWCYSWSTSDAKYAGKDSAKYTVKEVITSTISSNYTVSFSEKTDTAANKTKFNITNTRKKKGSSSSSGKSSVKTGDSAKMWVYYLIGAAALIAVVLIIVRKRLNVKDHE